MTERDIQDGFDSWLRQHQIPFIRSRMDKATTIKTGWPDFSVFFMSRCLFIETKSAGGKLSDDQKKCIAFIRLSGNRVEVCHSVSECVETMKNILLEDKPPSEAPEAEQYPWKQHFEFMKQKVREVGLASPGNGKVDSPICKSHGTDFVRECPRCRFLIYRFNKKDLLSVPVLAEPKNPGGTIGEARESTKDLKPAGMIPGESRGGQQKFYITSSNIGQVVVAKDLKGEWQAIRAASEADVANLPQLTEAVT